MISRSDIFLAKAAVANTEPGVPAQAPLDAPAAVTPAPPAAQAQATQAPATQAPGAFNAPYTLIHPVHGATTPVDSAAEQAEVLAQQQEQLSTAREAQEVSMGQELKDEKLKLDYAAKEEALKVRERALDGVASQGDGRSVERQLEAMSNRLTAAFSHKSLAGGPRKIATTNYQPGGRDFLDPRSVTGRSTLDPARPTADGKPAPVINPLRGMEPHYFSENPLLKNFQRFIHNIVFKGPQYRTPAMATTGLEGMLAGGAHAARQEIEQQMGPAQGQLGGLLAPFANAAGKWVGGQAGTAPPFDASSLGPLLSGIGGGGVAYPASP